MKKVGIYSGTFDPVHNGHLAFAGDALRQCGLDKVFFLVEPRPRRKQGVKAFEHRWQMVQLAIAGEPKFGSIMLEQAQFTATETLPVLQERFKGAELCLLMGDDWLKHFADWPHVEELAQSVTFAIGLRHTTRQEAEALLKTIQQTRGLTMRYRLFQAPVSDVASSNIRAAIKRGTRPVGVPVPVLSYIKEHRLYASADSVSSASSK